MNLYYLKEFTSYNGQKEDKRLQVLDIRDRYFEIKSWVDIKFEEQYKSDMYELGEVCPFELG